MHYVLLGIVYSNHVKQSTVKVVHKGGRGGVYTNPPKDIVCIVNKLIITNVQKAINLGYL